MAELYDRWHKKKGTALCEHKLFPSAKHGRGRRWAVRWYDPNTGEQEELLFDTKPAAKRQLNKVGESIDSGRYIAPKDGQVKVGVVAQRWLENRKFKNLRTYAQYESRLNVHIINVIGHLSLVQCKPSVIVEWINGRREAGLDETTIGLIYAHLKAIFESAVEDELIGRNPCSVKSVKDVKPRRSKRPPKKVPVTAVQADAIRTGLPDRYQAIVDVGRGLGMRQGEIFALGPNDIDRSTGMVHVQHQVAWDRGTMVFAPPKCSDNDEERDRYIPLSSEVDFALATHAMLHPPVEVTLPWKTREGEPRTLQLYFTSREHKALNKNYFNYLWKAGLETAGLVEAVNDLAVGRGRRWQKCRDKMMHSLRHLYASERLEEGMSIRTLANRLGHSDPAYTMRRYVHEHDTDFEQERSRIDESFRKSRAKREGTVTPEGTGQ
jgi:integrase